MVRVVLARIGVGAVLVWLVATATFLLVAAAPGDIASRLADPRIPPEARQRWRQQFGLDRPLAVRYADWLRTAAAGDLGVSWLHRRPVTAVLGRAIPNTMLLAGCGLTLEIIGGIAVALVQLRRPGGLVDRTLAWSSLAAYAVPTFGVALALIAALSYRLDLLPPSHMLSPEGELARGLPRLADLGRHLVLPVLAIAITGIGAMARYVRGSLLDERSAAYVLAARARGCSWRRAIAVHALPNALIPLVTMAGLSLPFLVSGSLVIEVVFAWPGMGQLMYGAALGRDIPLLLGGTLAATIAVVAGNLASDLVTAAIDPRVRL